MLVDWMIDMHGYFSLRIRHCIGIGEMESTRLCEKSQRESINWLASSVCDRGIALGNLPFTPATKSKHCRYPHPLGPHNHESRQHGGLGFIKGCPPPLRGHTIGQNKTEGLTE